MDNPFDRPGYHIHVPRKGNKDEAPREALHDVLHGEEIITHPRPLLQRWGDWYRGHRRWVWLIGGVAAAAIIGLIIYFIVLGGAQGYTGRKVSFSFTASEMVSAGGTVKYTIQYLNSEAVPLQDSQLIIAYPRGFKFVSASLAPANSEGTIWDLGTIWAQGGGKIEIEGEMDADPDSLQTARATLSYLPFGMNSEFSEEAAADTVIIPSPVSIRALVPETTASGNSIECELLYRNEGAEAVDEVTINATFPSSFTPASATPAASENNNFWSLGRLDPGQTGSILIDGTLTGSSGEYKQFDAEIRTGAAGGTLLGRDTASVKIGSMDILLTEVVRGTDQIVIEPGESLTYTVTYENRSSVPLSNAIVETTLPAQYIDEQKVVITGNQGIYRDGKIKWDAAGVPALAMINPGNTGTLTFKVDVLDVLPTRSADDKNFRLESQTILTSPDVPVSVSQDHIIESNNTIAKIRTSVVLVQVARYFDQTTGKAVGTGPFPPKVGSPTVFQIAWEVSNTANDVTGMAVAAKLAPGVIWAGGAVSSLGAGLVYDDVSKTISWNIGTLPANSGTLLPKAIATFLVQLTPGVNQIGQEVQLMQSANLIGTDSFVGENKQIVAEAVTTKLEEDAYAGTSGKVVP